MIKITSEILSIPHYISTTWTNIASLHVVHDQENPTLVIEQLRGGEVVVPGLSWPAIEAIFSAHADALEKPTKSLESETKKMSPFDIEAFSMQIPFKLIGDHIEPINMLLQHNPKASDRPDLPSEILEKIGSMIKMLGIDDLENLPPPEKGCNCTFCQVSRAIQTALPSSQQPSPSSVETATEDAVSEEDLQFRNWDIKEIADQLYTVTNPLDLNEQYNVYLGNPIGCTCGKSGCDHIKAVLCS